MIMILMSSVGLVSFVLMVVCGGVLFGVIYVFYFVFMFLKFVRFEM